MKLKLFCFQFYCQHFCWFAWVASAQWAYYTGNFPFDFSIILQINLMQTNAVVKLREQMRSDKRNEKANKRERAKKRMGFNWRVAFEHGSVQFFKQRLSSTNICNVKWLFNQRNIHRFCALFFDFDFDFDVFKSQFKYIYFLGFLERNNQIQTGDFLIKEFSYSFSISDRDSYVKILVWHRAVKSQFLQANKPSQNHDVQ